MAKKKTHRAEPQRQLRRDAVIKVFHEFCEMSSVHGVRFLGDPTVGILGKIMWAVALVACTIVLCNRTVRLSKVMDASPTEVRVLSTRTALEEVPFPSVVFCPYVQLVRGRAMELLVDYFESNFPPNTYNFQDPNFMIALNETYEALLRYLVPMMRTMKANVKKAEAVFGDALKDLDLSEFFHKASPTCEEIFERCRWHDMDIDCCREVQRKESTFGPCYAFNSLVTIPRKNCTVESLSDIGDNAACFVRHSAINGAFTGLTVTVKRRTDNTLKITDGLSVAVSASTAFPALDGFHQTKYQPGLLTQIALSTVVTQTLQEIADIPVQDRDCQFQDETFGDFAIDTFEKLYYRYNCETRCIAQAIFEECRCQPHMIPEFLVGEQRPVCNFTHLRCISTFARNRSVGAECSCKPRCEDQTFSTEILEKVSEYNACVIDVFYSSGDGSVMYQRQLTIDMRSAIVSFGGLAGLLLGCSVLSMAELVYYLGRTISALIAPTREEAKKRPPKAPIFPNVSSPKISTFPWNP